MHRSELDILGIEPELVADRPRSRVWLAASALALDHVEVATVTGLGVVFGLPRHFALVDAPGVAHVPESGPAGTPR